MTTVRRAPGDRIGALPRRFTAAVMAAAGLATVLTVAHPLPAQATGRTLYVAPWGQDFYSDGWTPRPNSQDRPWASIRRAVQWARPGDTIMVRGGTYVGPVGWHAVAGRPDAPITLTAYPGERVVLRGTLQLVGTDYWTVRGLHIERDPAGPRTQFVVKIDGGTGWQFLDNEVSGSLGVANLMISGTGAGGAPRDYVVAGNCIHDNRSAGGTPMNFHNIYLMSGNNSGRGLVERNLVFGAPNGANIKAAGPNASSSTGNIVIRYNTLADASVGLALGYGSNRVVTSHNLIGPRLGAPYAYDAGVTGNHVSGYGNLVADTGVYGYKKLVASTRDSTRPVPAVRVVRVTPRFNATGTCSGYRPTDPRAAAYGAFAR